MATNRIPKKDNQFYMLWKRIRLEWAKEVRDKLHSRAGMNTVVANLLETDCSAISNAKNGYRNYRLKPKDYVVLSNRFSIPIEELVRVQLKKVDNNE